MHVLNFSTTDLTTSLGLQHKEHHLVTFGTCSFKNSKSQKRKEIAGAAIWRRINNNKVLEHIINLDEDQVKSLIMSENPKTIT
jgi:hypothetical protein